MVTRERGGVHNRVLKAMPRSFHYRQWQDSRAFDMRNSTSILAFWKRLTLEAILFLCCGAIVLIETKQTAQTFYFNPTNSLFHAQLEGVSDQLFIVQLPLIRADFIDQVELNTGFKDQMSQETRRQRPEVIQYIGKYQK